MPTPVVSYLMAINRDDGFLDQAVAAILGQSFRDIELIIVANRCSDDLWTKLQQIEDPRVRLFRTEIGQLPFNLNFALNEAWGEFVARADADDIDAPDRIQKQVEFLRRRPDVDVVSGAYREINQDGVETGRFSPPLDHAGIERAMRWSCCLPHPSVMLRRRTLLEFGGYAYSLYAEDYDLWLRMLRSKKVKFASLPDVVLDYRVHGHQMSSIGKKRQNYPIVAALLIREFLYTGHPAFLGGILKRTLGLLRR